MQATEIGSITHAFGQRVGEVHGAGFAATVEPISAFLAIRSIEVARMAMQSQYANFQRVFDIQA